MRPVVPRIVNSVSYVTRISHDSHFAWQAQYLVKFKCHFSWQGQYSVKFGMIAARHAHFLLNVPVSISSSSKPKDPKPNDDPDEDETDPQAGPSSGPPILPVDDDEQQNQNDEKSDTVEYNSAPEGITDSDDTVDYQDLVINDDASWSLLTQEQKICSNTGSFSVPRYIDNSPVDVMHVRSSNFYDDRHWTHRGQKNVRRNYSDITEVYDQLNPEDSAFMTLYQSLDKSSLLVGKKRKEATQQEKRELAKQFLEAKRAECQSWFDNDVFELVDLRKIRVRNFVKGRWVLTVKKDKDGHFLKCKARWVLKGFQDKQKDSQQTDSPAASRSGFRCATQQAANLDGTSIIWILRQPSSKEKHMMRPVTSFVRFLRNVGILHTWALG